MEKKHISYSQIITFVKCPAHWLFRYICNIVVPPPSAMIQGRSIHKTLAHAYTYKRANAKDIEEKTFLEVYEGDINKEFEEEVEFKEGEKPADLIDSGVRVLREYRRERMPQVMPVEIESRFDVDFKNTDYSLVGYIDLVDDKGNVIDHKTTRATPNQVEISNDQQLTAYALGYRETFKKKEKGLQLDYLVTTKIPKIVVMKTQRGEEDIKRFLTNVALVKKAIDENNFYCIHSSNDWTCRANNCGYEARGYHKELYRLGVNKFIEKYGRGGTATEIIPVE